MTKEVSDEFTVLWQQMQHSRIMSFQTWGSVSTLPHTTDGLPGSPMLHEIEGGGFGVLGGFLGQLSDASVLPPGA